MCHYHMLHEHFFSFIFSAFFLKFLLDNVRYINLVLFVYDND